MKKLEFRCRVLGALVKGASAGRTSLLMHWEEPWQYRSQDLHLRTFPCEVMSS